MNRPPLRQLAAIFFKIGVFGFGGQLVVLNMIREALVKQRQWLEPDRFEEGAALAQLLPGPTMFQMATFVGEELHSLIGAGVCATALIAPAFVAVMVIGGFYKATGNTGVVRDMFSLIGPAAVALVVAAAVQLSRKHIKRIVDIWPLACGFTGVAVFHWSPALLLLALGIMGALVRSRTVAVMAIPDRRRANRSDAARSATSPHCCSSRPAHFSLLAAGKS